MPTVRVIFAEQRDADLFFEAVDVWLRSRATLTHFTPSNPVAAPIGVVRHQPRDP